MFLLAAVFILSLVLSACAMTSSKTERTPEPIPVPTPTQEEVHNGLVEPLLTFHPGTAGSSLKRAVTAVKVLSFASRYAVADISVDWKKLTQEERASFGENVASVSALLEETRSDFDSFQGLYEDAGVLEQINSLKDDANAWDNSASILKELEKLAAAE